jgi:DNA-binding GntR family transcriptional regulator
VVISSRHGLYVSDINVPDLELVEAIKNSDADQAEQVVREHVQDFYDTVRVILMDG